MPTLSRMKNFFRNIFAKRRNDRELDDEVRILTLTCLQKKRCEKV